MKTTLILITFSILFVSVFTKENSVISAEFFNGFFSYNKGETWKFNQKCINYNLKKEYEKLASVITAHWLDIGDVFKAMSEVEEAVTSQCDFPELKEFNQIYTEQKKNGNYVINLNAKAIYLAQIIKDLYDSSYRHDPEHIGITMAKIAKYIVYVDDKSWKFLS